MHKEQNVRFKSAPLTERQVDHQLQRQMHVFLHIFLTIFYASLNEILGAPSSATQSVSSKSPFIESFCVLFSTN